MKRYTINHTEAIYRWLSDNNFTLVVIDYEASEQLRSCQAWLLPFTMKDDLDGEYYHGYLLQSYETIVSFMAVGEKVGDILTVDLGKWSPTTSRQ